MARDDLVAAPADDGGHHGVFSRPVEELTTPDGSPRHPPTDADPAEPGGYGGGGSLVGWAIVFALITAFFAWAYAC